MSENSTKLGLVDCVEIRLGKDKTIFKRNVWLNYFSEGWWVIGLS